MSGTAPASDDLQDMRPVVPTSSTSDWGMWGFVGVLLIGGAALFNALSASEEAAQSPSVFAPQETARSQISSPPPLRTPDRFELAPIVSDTPMVAATSPRSAPIASPVFQPTLPPPPPIRLNAEGPTTPTPAAPVSTAPEVVFEAEGQAGPVPPSDRAENNAERVLADRLANPSRTIPQGTVIPAVLETAIDSTRPGGVRALVQRDISSFDGSRILIPRGSRLYGEYDARLQQGQNRALVQWTRLIRPDGVTIALDSPSSDPLGRAGIRGRVDTKFFQRFGGALLNSVLDIGVGLAVNEASDGVVVALPGSTQNIRVTEPESIRPTLSVRHGTSVSVFVARDLDFSSVDP